RSPSLPAGYRSQSGTDGVAKAVHSPRSGRRRAVRCAGVAGYEATARLPSGPFARMPGAAGAQRSRGPAAFFWRGATVRGGGRANEDDLRLDPLNPDAGARRTAELH